MSMQTSSHAFFLHKYRISIFLDLIQQRQKNDVNNRHLFVFIERFRLFFFICGEIE